MDFETSAALWDDVNRLEIPARSLTEERLVIVGKIDGKLWSAVITYRGERVRIISVRRARENEVRIYGS